MDHSRRKSDLISVKIVFYHSFTKVNYFQAKETGVGWVTARNSNHFGIAGYYTAMAEKQGTGSRMLELCFCLYWEIEFLRLNNFCRTPVRSLPCRGERTIETIASLDQLDHWKTFNIALTNTFWTGMIVYFRVFHTLSRGGVRENKMLFSGKTISQVQDVHVL